MPHKLFVDDIRPAPEGWIQVRTITEAIRFLSQFDVDEISLDHDIECLIRVGEHDIPHASPETFMAVAYYICEKIHHNQTTIDTCSMIETPKITIHSANPVGAEAMRKLFKEHSIHPIIRPASRVNRLESEV